MDKFKICCFAATCIFMLFSQKVSLAQPETRSEIIEELGERFDFSKQEIEEIIDYAQILGERFEVPVSVIISIMLFESGWGSSEISREGNNYFGLTKSFDGEGKTIKVQHPVFENGKKTYTQVDFRTYENWRESMDDFILFIYAPRRWWYHDALNCPTENWECMVDGLSKTKTEPGFATDPKWNAGIKRTISNYGLMHLD